MSFVALQDSITTARLAKSVSFSVENGPVSGDTMFYV